MSSRYLIDLKMRKSKIIHVYRNGDKYSRPALILLKPIEQKELERIFKAVEEKITLPNSKPIKRIFTIEGDEIEKSWQIEDQSYYVVGSTENFIKTCYGTVRFWSIMGPVKWSKSRDVIYEPPEPREISTCRITYDHWNQRSFNRPSSKMTKSMSAFPSDRKALKKDKKMTLTINRVPRPVSEPPNDIEARCIRNDDVPQVKTKPLVLEQDLPDLNSFTGNRQMDSFLNDSIQISSDQYNDKHHKLGLSNPTNKLKLEQKSSKDEDKVKIENDECDSLEMSDEDATSDNFNKFKERKFETSEDKTEESTDIIENSDFKNKVVNKQKGGIAEENADLTSSLSTEEINEYESTEKSESSEIKENEKQQIVVDNKMAKETLLLKEDDGEKSMLKDCDKIVNNEDVEDDDSLYEKEKAALLIQANFRGKTFLRKKIAKPEIKKEERIDDDLNIKNKAATVIQSNFRGHMVREGLKSGSENNSDLVSREEISDRQWNDEEEDLEEKEKAAVKIQSSFRGHLVREDLKNSSKHEAVSDEEMSEKDKEAEEKAAIVIQSNFRGHLVREDLKNSSKQQLSHTSEECKSEEDIEVEEKAALVIQSNFRGHLVRENLKHSSKFVPTHTPDLSHEQSSISEEVVDEDSEEKEKAALVIQSNFRGHLVRENLKHSSKSVPTHTPDLSHEQSSISEEVLDEDLEQKQKAALVIQSNFRGHLVRENMKLSPKHGREEKQGNEDSNSYKSNEDETEDNLEEKEKAALVIQSNFRGHLVREHMKSVSKHKDESKIDEEEVMELEEEEESLEFSEEESDDNLKLEDVSPVMDSSNSHAVGITLTDEHDHDMEQRQLEKAATVIQSNFRGYLTRAGLKSTSNAIDDYEDNAEQDRSYAAPDSDEDDDDLNYSDQKNPKNDVINNDPSQFNNTFSDDPFLYNNKS